MIVQDQPERGATGGRVSGTHRVTPAGGHRAVPVAGADEGGLGDRVLADVARRVAQAQAAARAQ